MLKTRGYLANPDSPLDGGAFSIRHSSAQELVDWLKNETDNGMTVVFVEVKELT